MAHAETPSLIALGLATDVSQEGSSFRWGLATSCFIHALIIVLAVSLRFQSTIEEPFRTIDVALISLPETQNSGSNQEKSAPPKPALPKTQPSAPEIQPALPKAQPMEERLPPLPTQTASERLSEFLGGAIGSILVPDKQELASPTTPPQIPDQTLPETPSPLIENLRLPSTAPQLSRPERLHPTQPFTIPNDDPTPSKQTTHSTMAPPQPKESEKLSPVQPPDRKPAINQAPALPELSPVIPFQRAEKEMESNEFSSSTNLAESLKQNLPTLPRPLPTQKIQRKSKSSPLQQKKSAVPEMSAPQLAKIQPSHPLKKLPQRVETSPQHVKPSTQRVKPLSQATTPQHVEQALPSQEMSKMMKQLLGEVKVPSLKRSPANPHSQQTMPPSTPLTKPVQSEMDQRIAKLSIPDVTPVESIKNRLQLLEVQSTSNSANSSSQASPGKNQYLAMVEERIDRQWVAPPLVASHPVVVLKFRISRSGEISHIFIDESSGNGHYDSAAQRAVHAVNPLPPFPPDISDSYFDVRYRFIKE